MVNQQLLDYIKQQTQQGILKEAIINNLSGQGWQQQDINEAFSYIASGQAPTPPIEKKHDMAWVVVNILIRGGIVIIPVYIVLMIILGIILAKTGITPESIMQRALADKEFADNIKMIYQLVGLILFPISYFGIRWGCKYVSKKTYVEEKDFGKVGYWVGLVPVVLSAMSRDLAAGSIIFGIFVTPRLVKKWLVKFQSQFRGENLR